MFYNNRLWLIAAGAALIINSILLAFVMYALKKNGYTNRFSPTFPHVRLVMLPPEGQRVPSGVTGLSKITLKPKKGALTPKRRHPPAPVRVSVKSPRIKPEPPTLIQKPAPVVRKPKTVQVRPPVVRPPHPVRVRRRTAKVLTSTRMRATPLPPGVRKGEKIGGGGAATGGGGGAAPGGGHPAGGGSTESAPAAGPIALADSVPAATPVFIPEGDLHHAPGPGNAPPSPPGVGDGPAAPLPGGAGSAPPGGSAAHLAPTVTRGVTSGEGAVPGNGAGDKKGSASGTGMGNTTGGNTGASTGTGAGSNAGGTAGLSGGSTAGSSAGSTAGNTAGGTAGGTAGSTGGATAGSTAGDGTGVGTGGPFGIGAGGGGEGPRHIVYLLDMSPSMESRIMRAKQELHDTLATLQPGESFEVIAFSADNRRFSRTAKIHRDHGNDLVPATPDSIQQATQWMSGLPLWGGTDLWQALKGALQIREVNVLVLITDGVPTVGETDFNRLARRVREANQKIQARIYTIGLVGADVPIPPQRTPAEPEVPPAAPAIQPPGSNKAPALPHPDTPGKGTKPISIVPSTTPPSIPTGSASPGKLPAPTADAAITSDDQPLPAPPEPDHSFEAETLLRELARESGGEYKQVVLGVNTPESGK